MKKIPAFILAAVMLLPNFASALTPPDYATHNNVEELVYWITTFSDGDRIGWFDYEDYKGTISSLRKKEYILAPEDFSFVTIYPDWGADDVRVELNYSCGISVDISDIKKEYIHLIEEGIDKYFSASLARSFLPQNIQKVNDGTTLDILVVKGKTNTSSYYISDGHEIRVTSWSPSGKATTVPLRKIPLDSVPWLIERAYDDVGESDWFYEDVEYTAFKKIWKKTEENTFSPNLPTDRATITAALYAVAGKPWKQIGLPTFSDVSADADYAKAIAWAEENNIVKGFEENLFLPERNISRQDFAVMLLRYLDYIGYEYDMPTEKMTFSDGAQIAEYAQKAVGVMYDLEIIKGKANNILDPRGDVTRAEAAVMFHRIMEITEK
ncbi:MAG: S-layer homology domain-containing protein [Ruminococcaceae bacterium]|nr:S-layer homology domain-containing protein [Oscillospiraceae bacterium]